MPERLRKIASRLGERQLVWAVNLLLLFIVVQSVVGLTQRWLEPAPETEAPQVVATVAVTSEPSAQVLAKRIADGHLFGFAQNVAVASSGPTVAPETKLNLILSGMIASLKQEDALAIIADGAKGDEKSYGIGGSLPGGAVLKEIYGDRVIIEHRGRVETLTLRRKKLSNKELTIKNK